MPNKYIAEIEKLVIDIAGVLFTVITEAEMIERFGMQGQIDFRTNQIVLDPDMSSRDTLTVLIHEVVEGIIRRYQANIPHETIVFLECSLFTVLMDNPKMLRILLEEAETGKRDIELEEKKQNTVEEILNKE